MTPAEQKLRELIAEFDKSARERRLFSGSDVAYREICTKLEFLLPLLASPTPEDSYMRGCEDGDAAGYARAQDEVERKWMDIANKNALEREAFADEIADLRSQLPCGHLKANWVAQPIKEIRSSVGYSSKVNSRPAMEHEQIYGYCLICKEQAEREGKLLELVVTLRNKAIDSREESGRIRRTVNVATDAESNCMIRAEVWDADAYLIEAALGEKA